MISVNTQRFRSLYSKTLQRQSHYTLIKEADDMKHPYIMI
jgi:hypothetical protein